MFKRESVIVIGNRVRINAEGGTTNNTNSTNKIAAGGYRRDAVLFFLIRLIRVIRGQLLGTSKTLPQCLIIVD
jgi:hypothetical protein